MCVYFAHEKTNKKSSIQILRGPLTKGTRHIAHIISSPEASSGLCRCCCQPPPGLPPLLCLDKTTYEGNFQKDNLLLQIL